MINIWLLWDSFIFIVDIPKLIHVLNILNFPSIRYIVHVGISVCLLPPSACQDCVQINQGFTDPPPEDHWPQAFGNKLLSYVAVFGVFQEM